MMKYSNWNLMKGNQYNRIERQIILCKFQKYSKRKKNWWLTGNENGRNTGSSVFSSCEEKNGMNKEAVKNIYRNSEKIWE